MSSSSVMTNAIAAKMNARIKQLLDDGLSDSQIIRVLRREAVANRWPELNSTSIKNMINAVLDAEESASESSESSAPSFESDEEYEEYVPEESSESEVETVEEESESEVETVEEESESESEVETVEKQDAEEVVNGYIFFDHNDGSMDRIRISPSDEGVFQVEMAYDIPSSYAFPRRANFFEGDADAVYTYIRDILLLVHADEMPFEAVEVALPFFPNVSFRPKTLKKSVRKLVLRALCQFLEHRFE